MKTRQDWAVEFTKPKSLENPPKELSVSIRIQSEKELSYASDPHVDFDLFLPTLTMERLLTELDELLPLLVELKKICCIEEIRLEVGYDLSSAMTGEDSHGSPRYYGTGTQICKFPFAYSFRDQ